MLSPTLGDDRLGRRDDLEADRAALTAALERIDHLERLVARSTVVPLRYAWRPSGRRGLRLECTDCEGTDRVVAAVESRTRHLAVETAIRRHEAEFHAQPRGPRSIADLVVPVELLDGCELRAATFPSTATGGVDG
jgi:hypothetical protein